MTKQSENGANPPGSDQSAGLNLQRELIVVASSDAGLRAGGPQVFSVNGADLNALASVLTTENIQLEPLFGESEEKIKARTASVSFEADADIPDLSVYYRVKAPDARLEALAETLRNTPGIEAAYVKPPAEPADFTFNNLVPDISAPPAVTPDFSGRQGYLGPAPVGIDAQYAWTLGGGRGAGVNIIDIEWGWNFAHEDLLQNQGGVVAGANAASKNHGTAVLGEFSGDRNSLGINGISPDARVTAVSLETYSTAQAIRMAADRLNPGDIMLLEVHRRGPNGGLGNGQFGFVAVEWWPDDFDAIRYAVAKGVVVVEAAGNGGQNLDAAVYNTPQAGFPASWRNPFNMANPTSGAVLVGAGMPPAGTHGRNAETNSGDRYADRGRCYFSNYGARVDAQGWGWEVTTTGYGDLQGGADQNLWYTDQFSGTSSASPIVVGALACVQGVLRSSGRVPLSPARARELLRATGSPQQIGPAFTFQGNMAGSGYPQNHPQKPVTQRIGNRPNLRQLISTALQTSSWVGVQFTGSLAASASGRWFTFNWPAHWHVIWTVVPTSPAPGAPQLAFKVQVERSSDQFVTYWINVSNLTNRAVNFEGRFAVLGW